MKISNLISLNLLLAWCLATVIFSQPAFAQISLTAGALSPNATVVPVGGERQITAPVSGTANQTVVWTVNGICGGNPNIGTIDSNGLYTAPLALTVSGAASITATSAAEGITKAASNIFLNDPQILTINRFLDQSTFGATSALTAHVKQVGFENFIDEQFNTPESVYPNPASATRNQIVNRFGLMLSKEMTNCASASFML